MTYILDDAMTKRLIEIDDALLERARQSLGTTGIRDTVIAALERAVVDESIDEREARIARLSDEFVEATRDLRDPEVMRGAWH
jgi:Arc/MetJ family transcription regulator